MAGAVLGVVGAMMLPDLVVLIQNARGEELLSTEIYPINYLPTAIRVFDVVAIVAVALIMSFIATLIPAFQAARLQPALVLNQRT